MSEDALHGSQVPVAPDGGWGWVVVLASFLSFVILDGAMFTYGVFYVELLDYFEESKGATALVGSILMGMSMLFGPFASIMINLWGLRKVAICGTFLSFLAFGCSMLAPSLEVLMITYGFLGGSGIAMVYVPAVVVVGFYFDKWRALANGITSSGSGVGTFVFSPLFSYLIDEYTWKGAMLLLAGIVLHCLVLSSVYRPLRYKVHVCFESVQTDTDKVHVHPDELKEQADIKTLGGSAEVYDATLELDTKAKMDKKYTFSEESKAQSVTNIHSYDRTDLLKSVQLKGHWTAPKHFDPLSEKLGKQSATESLTHINLCTCLKPEISAQLSHSFGNVSSCTSKHFTSYSPAHEITLKPLEKRDIFYSGSLTRLSNIRNYGSGTLEKADTQVKKNMLEAAPSICKLHNLKNTILRITGVYLLKNPVFLFIVAYSVLWTAHSTILTILPHYCTEEGYTALKAATLLSIIGAANILGRLLAGWISNFERVDCMFVNIVALFMGGIACLVVPFTHNYMLMCIEAAVFGTGMATWTSLRPIILVELLGINNLTSAFGLLAMFQGVAFIVGPPIAGILYDVSGSYKIPFILAGSAFILSGSICILMKRLFGSRKKA